MNLEKFGIKIYLKENKNYSSRDYIPVFHGWIQEKAIPDHLLIDVADYSHISDGPGIMLIAHEGHFSLDQENNKPGMLYMRRAENIGSFKERFDRVFSMAVHGATLLEGGDNELEFSQNSFRFIANDRRLAENTNEYQDIFQKEIQGILENKFPNVSWDIKDISSGNERLAFTVHFITNVKILNKN